MDFLYRTATLIQLITRFNWNCPSSKPVTITKCMTKSEGAAVTRQDKIYMMTMWLWHAFRITAPLCKESTGVKGFPSQRASYIQSFDIIFVISLKKLLNTVKLLINVKSVPEIPQSLSPNKGDVQSTVPANVNTLKPRQNGHHFPDNIFNKNV